MFDPADIIPIKIRDDVVIHVQGIPHDFTIQEAKRVAEIILAYADVKESKSAVEQQRTGTPLSDQARGPHQGNWPS